MLLNAFNARKFKNIFYFLYSTPPPPNFNFIYLYFFASKQVTVISGGISNALYKLSPPSTSFSSTSSLSPIVLRIYGIGTEKFVDREKEVTMMQLLHRNGFGPQILGLFTNGRIESFLAMRCLTPDEMSSPDFSEKIAATLFKFHAVDAENRPATAVTPFTRIYEWLDIAQKLDFSDDPNKLAAFDKFNFTELKREVETVDAAALPLHSPIVFAHNDLLSGNIMIPIDTTSTNTNNSDKSNDQMNNTSMTFIDFEYSGWAPRGFDLGNHFCEYAGFECDYTKYPDRHIAGTFLKAYLSAATAVEGDGGSSGNENRVVDEKKVGVAVAEANVYSLAAHQYWGTWALMQARWSKIEFDYMGYAALRWGEYRRRKDEFLQQAREAAALV
jgi:ethanolamine kinase